jgi:hypothetical protein
MQDLHWRYNFNTDQFDFVENNPLQHYEPLLQHVTVPTLVIDINLVAAVKLETYLTSVLDQAAAQHIKFQQIIYDGTQDPFFEYGAKTRLLDSFSKTQGLKAYLSLSQFETHQHANLTELCYPSWLWVFKRQQLPSWQEIEQQSKTHAFSCLNRNPSFHRLVFYTLLKQQGLLDQFVYSFYDRCPYQGHAIHPQQYRGLENLIGSVLLEQCINSIADFPISWKNETLGSNDHSLAHDAYQNAYCNVVTETSALIPFVSEKIWKPIAAGQLFLVVGAANTCAWLKQLGFYTFDDYYDSKISPVSRITHVVEAVGKHADSAADWHQQNQFQIEHNYHWFHSGNVEKQLLDPVIAQLNNK